jgi:hypothetical protein
VDRHGGLTNTTAISIETLSSVAKGSSCGFVGVNCVRYCFTTAWLRGG